MAESRAMRLGLVSDVYIETLPLDPLVSPVGRIYGIEGGVSLRYVGSKGLVTFATTHDLRAYQKRLGYTAENIDNKKVDFSDIDNTSYPTTKATVDYTEPLFEMKWNIDEIVTPFLLSVLVHIENVDLHVSSIDKSNWNSHVNNSGIHISSIERANWNSKQDTLIADTDYLTPTTAGTTYEPKKQATDLYVTENEKSTWSGKQDKLTAGTNISIEDNTISAKDTTYKDNDFDIKDLADSTNLRSTWSSKQNALVADTDYLTPTTAGTTYEPKKGGDEHYVSSNEKVEWDAKFNLSDTISGIDTKATTLVPALNEVNAIAKGATIGETFLTVPEMVDTLNIASQSFYPYGKNLYIIDLSVNDFWISEIEDTSIPYNYVDYDTLASDITNNGSVQIGYYLVSFLETPKVFLEDVLREDNITDDIESNKLSTTLISHVKGIYDFVTGLIVSAWSATTSHFKIPSEKLVKDSLDSKFNLSGGNSISGNQNFDGNLGIGTANPTSQLHIESKPVGIGTVSVEAGGTTVTGVGTKFLNQYHQGGFTITIGAETRTITHCPSDTSMIVSSAFTNAYSNSLFTINGVSKVEINGNSFAKFSYSDVITEINSNYNGVYGLRTKSFIKGAGFYLYNNTGGFYTSAGIPMFYTTAAGKFGIGTKTPNGFLEVKGSGGIILDAGNVGIGTTTPAAKLDVNGSVKVGNDTASASAANAGAIRYRADANNSYVEMCMQTGASTYAWVIIKQNTW